MLKKAVFIITMLFLASGFALSGLTVSNVQAGTVDLPQTGQTTSYAAGDDGDLEMGVPWLSPRFTDNRDGTVTDNLTGLIWLQNANCFVASPWTQALSDANSLASGSCGLTDGSVAGDWRLPNVNELESLINAEEADTAIWLNAQGFINVQSHYYWSSSTYASGTGYAWYVYMSYGYVNALYKASSSYVWMVRAATTPPAEIWETGQTTSYAAGDDGDIQAGVFWPSPRFTDNGDGTVTDNLTGLIWLQDANCFGTRTWSDALSDANSLASGSCSLTDGSAAGDWRLSNRKELHSLTDFEQYGLALPLDHQFVNVLSKYWSSTTYAFNTDYAWNVNMDYGSVSERNFLKTDSYYVWPVRAGIVSDPIPDIKANGSDGPVTIPQGDPLLVTVALDPGSYDGEDADWWVLATITPIWYHYDRSSGSWIFGIDVSYQNALFNLSPYTVLNTTGLLAGAYTFCFGVDMIMNGSLDLNQMYSDCVGVTIQ